VVAVERGGEDDRPTEFRCHRDLAGVHGLIP
jgi:hypothetical protein